MREFLRVAFLFPHLVLEICRPCLDSYLERPVRFTQCCFSSLQFQICCLSSLALFLHCSQQRLVGAAQSNGCHCCAIGHSRRGIHDCKEHEAKNAEEGILRSRKQQEQGGRRQDQKGTEQERETLRRR